MKGGGTEIEVLLTFERNWFTESKNLDFFFTFQFKTVETADEFYNYHNSLYRSIVQNVEYCYGKLLLRNLLFKVLISHFSETQTFLHLNSNAENTSQCQASIGIWWHQQLGGATLQPLYTWHLLGFVLVLQSDDEKTRSY